jgi:hypothetical protein
MTSILLIIVTGLLLSLVERGVRRRDEMKVLANANWPAKKPTGNSKEQI